VWPQITSSCSGLEQQFFCATFYRFGRTRAASGKPDAVPAAEHKVICSKPQSLFFDKIVEKLVLLFADGKYSFSDQLDL